MECPATALGFSISVNNAIGFLDLAGKLAGGLAIGLGIAVGLALAG